MTSRWTQR